MPEFYFTFGQKYRREPHPCEYAHPDGYVTVVAPDILTARLWFVNRFGNAFCSSYTEEDMERMKTEFDFPLFPLGELYRYHT